MSGVEVLGAVASAVQLADTCMKIAICAIDLFSRVRDAPETIRKRVVAVQQLVEVARLIEHNPSLQTPLIASVLTRARADADQLFEILTKIDAQPSAGKVVKYWKALEGITREKRILAICDRLQENKALLTLYIASINSDYLREINVELVTVRQGVDGIFKELPAIRDTAGKATIILDELSVTSAKISTLHDELPMMSGKITTIHDDIPVLAGKVMVIHDELPAIRDALQRLALSQQAHLEPISALSGRDQFIMPFDRDEDFVGRENVIHNIDRILSDRRTVRRLALAGLGGIGKTQIAIEFAYRLREKSPESPVFWVHASNASRIELSYRAIAAAAKLPGADDPKTDILNMVLRWLENGINRPWLMVLDNADDTAVFFSQAIADMSQTANKTEPVAPMSLYLPRTGGSILITSRNGDLATQLTGKPELVLKINNLEDDDALKLLQNKVSADHSPEADWVALIDALDRLPLAITQAAAYITMRRPRMSVSKYLEHFRHDEVKQIALLSMDGGDLRRDPEIPNAVVKTWQISFDQIKRQNVLATVILSRMCLFDRQGIPRFLINQDDDDFEFDEAIGVLIGFSFIRSQNDGDSFDMHPLVQLSTKKWLELHGEMDQRKEQALNLLSQTFPTGKYQNWTVCEILEPHVQHILRFNHVSQSCKLGRAKILHNNAWFALARGNYKIAETMARETASTREEILGLEDAATLASMGLLASTYSNQGRWKEAEELQAKELDICSRVLGQEHLLTLISMANLALTFWNQGRWKEAEELGVQVMKTRKRVLGEEHPSTLTSMANLASTFWNQGRWKEAEELEVQVMETRKRVLGEEHPDTLTSMANLASTYRNQGRWKEAEKLEIQVIETRKRVLGEEHPSTLTSIANLASTFWNQGRWKEAEELQAKELDICSRVLGEEHPSTLTSMANLASTFWNQGRWKEAEELQAKELDICSRVLGEEHPDTLISMANLAFTWRSQGRDNEAWKLMEECFLLRKRKLGADHPDTVSSLTSLNKWQAASLEDS